MARHVIKASFTTVQRGIISSQAKPILTIASGDTVIFDTWSMWDNAGGPELTLEDLPGGSRGQLWYLR